MKTKRLLIALGVALLVLLGYNALIARLAVRSQRQQALAAAGLGYLYPAHGLRLVLPFSNLLSNRCPVRARMGGEVSNGHAVNTRRTFVGLHPLPRLRQVVAGQHFFKQFCYHLSTSSCFKARCMLAAVRIWPARA